MKSRRRVNSDVMFLRSSRQIAVMTLVTVLSAAGSSFAQHRNVSPSQAVRSFYRFHYSHDMGFAKHNVARRRRWLTQTLFQLLINEFRRDEQYAKGHPNEIYVPYMEGDPFTDSQVHPTSFRIGRSEVAGNKATVAVLMVWSAGSREGPDKRNLRIQLLRIRGKWLIDNVVNRDDGNDLVADLKRTEYLP
jgi:hypothetical protein